MIVSTLESLQWTAGANDRSTAFAGSLAAGDNSTSRFMLRASFLSNQAGNVSQLQIGNSGAGTLTASRHFFREVLNLFNRAEMPDIPTFGETGNFTGPTNPIADFIDLTGSLSGGRAAEPDEKSTELSMAYLPTPEPSPVVALVSGVAVLLLVRRRRHSAD